MKIISINTVAFGSTGRIAKVIAQEAIKKGYEYKCAIGRGVCSPDDYLINKSKIGLNISSFLSRLTGNHENFNASQTRKLIKWISKEKPDLIHLHNLHGNYINIKILFNYINKHHIPIVWTFHDCWPITGHCTHFDSINCQKWEKGCYECPLYKQYPRSWFFDRSKHKYKKKKKLFSSIENLTIVSPSKWVASKVSDSFLNKYPIEVINNGIDIEEFVLENSFFRKKYGLENKFVVLGVASPWSDNKGLNNFSKLAEELPDEYRIVLVGTCGEIMSKKIIALPRINDKNLLNEIYSSADVFLNLTLADTFPTVNFEALACGTPVITFDTGGCREQVDEDSGIIVKKGDVEGVKKALEYVKNNPFDPNKCIEQSQKFSVKRMTDGYIALYDKILKENEGE